MIPKNTGKGLYSESIKLDTGIPWFQSDLYQIRSIGI